MKNFMVVDGARNSTFDVFEIDDAMFAVIFPDDSDVAFLDEVADRIKTLGLGEVAFFNQIYSNRLDKKNINGLHGILHSTGSYCRKEYYPLRRETDIAR